MKLSDKQILRIMEVLDLRVRQLEQKQSDIDEELQDEVHDLRSILNIFALERELRRLKNVSE